MHRYNVGHAESDLAFESEAVSGSCCSGLELLVNTQMDLRGRLCHHQIYSPSTPGSMAQSLLCDLLLFFFPLLLSRLYLEQLPGLWCEHKGWNVK